MTKAGNYVSKFTRKKNHLIQIIFTKKISPECLGKLALNYKTFYVGTHCFVSVVFVFLFYILSILHMFICICKPLGRQNDGICSFLYKESQKVRKMEHQI